MGVTNDVIKEIYHSDPKKEQLGETADLLMDICQLKRDIFKTKIEEDLRAGKILATSAPLLPITHVLRLSTEYRYLTQDHITDVPDKAAEAFARMFQIGTPQYIIKGLSSLVTDVINSVIKSEAGTENEWTLCSCCIDDSGATSVFVRIDMMMWSRNISTKNLNGKIDNIFSIVCYKSALDITKMPFCDFCSLYTVILERGFEDFPEDEKEKKIIDALNIARKIYDELKGNDNNNNKELLTTEALKKINPLNFSKLTRLF